MKKKSRIEKALFKTLELRETTKDSMFRAVYTDRATLLEWVLSDLDQDLYQ